jgi:hypothetical protein
MAASACVIYTNPMVLRLQSRNNIFVTIKQELRWFLVEPSQLQRLDHVHATPPGVAYRKRLFSSSFVAIHADAHAGTVNALDGG